MFADDNVLNQTKNSIKVKNNSHGKQEFSLVSKYQHSTAVLRTKLAYLHTNI